MTAFEPLFVPKQLLDAVSDRAWFEAMLEVESALARAEATAGVVTADAAQAIADACCVELYDLGELLDQGRAVGNPAEPLVRALRQQVGGEAAGYVHRGATSQDVIDTASMLVARRALDLVRRDVDRAANAVAVLAEEHRSTPMVARTLLQQAVPQTFGFKAAGWLMALIDVRRRLEQVRNERLAVQLGGAAGTLAALGGHGLEVLRLLAAELELVEPELPWHTNRTRVAEVGGALAMCASVLAKIGLDLVLLAQTEVGEVREQTDGGSSTMPHKRNPVRSVLARACAELVSGYASVLGRSVVQEHERAAGAWQAEWGALSGALAYTGGAAWNVAGALEGLDVDAPRMEQNLELTGGLVVTERVALALGGGDAHDVVREAVLRSAESGRTFEEELRADESVDLTEGDLDAALDPKTYVGSAEAFVDRALALYREEQT
jgi:3-carboxy-cis,cis-muconate cycloisomerase